jgi:hypothetical protein
VAGEVNHYAVFALRHRGQPGADFLPDGGQCGLGAG